MPSLAHLVTRHQLTRAVGRAALLVLPVLFTIVLGLAFAHAGTLAFDFRAGAWAAGHRVLHGMTPYGPGAWFRPDPQVGYAYPAPASLLFAATATLPRDVAGGLALALGIAGLLLALRWSGVRDWRVYGLVFYWPTVIQAWQTANLTTYLIAATAAVWLLRERQAAAGVVVAISISLKLYLWPLAVFFAATRRWPALVYAAVGTAAINVAAWSVVGWSELPRFRDSVQHFARVNEGRDMSPLALIERSGASRPAAYAVTLTLAACVAAGCLAVGRRGRDREAFVLTVAVSLLASPILLPYYLAILVIPLALLRPRLGPLWFLPLAFWLSSVSFRPAIWQAATTLALTAALFAALLRAPSETFARPRQDSNLGPAD